MTTGQASGIVGSFEITCGNCANNDDGLCDKIGYLVDDDDKPHCSAEWELKE